MDLTHLEYFCTVATTKNISEAARRHYISQPTMSKYMMNLEKEMHTPLFIRTGNQIMLSEEGEKFYTYARQITANYKDAVSFLHEESRQLTLKLQVNTTRHILVNYLYEYLPSHPNVNLLIDFNSKEEALLDSSESSMYHYVIGTKNMHQYLNKSSALFSERQMLAVYKGHPLAERQTVSVNDLRDYLFITQARNRNYGKNLLNLCERNGFLPRLKVICNDSKYVCNMVTAGLGISLVPEFSWKPLLNDSIRLISISEMTNDLLHHSIFWNDDRYLPQDFIDFRTGLIAYYRALTD